MNQLVDCFTVFENKLKTYILTHNCQYVYISLGSKYNESHVNFHYPKKNTFTNSLYQMVPTFVRNMTYETNVLAIIIDDFHDDILLDHNNKHLLHIIDDYQNIDIIMLDFCITLQNLPSMLDKIMNCISPKISSQQFMICNFICFKRPNLQDAVLEEKIPQIVYNTLKNIQNGLYKQCFYQWYGYNYYTYHYIYHYETYRNIHMFHCVSLSHIFKNILEQSLDDHNKEYVELFVKKNKQHTEKWNQFKCHSICIC